MPRRCVETRRRSGVLIVATAALALGSTAWGAEGPLSADPALDAATTQPAVEPRNAPTTGPSVAPGSQEVADLIRKLGDPDSHVRNHATKRLQEIGPTALPAVKEAARDPNLEIQMRARAIAGEIEQPTAPNPPEAAPIFNGQMVQSVRMQTGAGVRIIDVTETGRTIHIEEDDRGIRMRVAGEVNKRPVTRDYKAKNPDDLRRQNAAAFALYDQWATELREEAPAGVRAVLRFQRGVGVPGVVPAPPIVPQVRLGVQVAPDGVDADGVTVTGILPNTRAEALGIKQGDSIRKINDQPIASAADLIAEMQKHPNGGLKVELQRDGKPVTLKE